jgi:hypothetical protein
MVKTNKIITIFDNINTDKSLNTICPFFLTMTAPLINIYKTKEEAFYFKNSWMNQFYSFDAIQLLPNNPLAYVQITDTPDGINLEDWTVNVVDLCKGTKVDITDYFNVDSLTNDLAGNPQLFWSITNVPFDFGYGLQYLEIEQAVGETFYSTPFLLTNEESEKTTQFHYKDKRTDTYQSIGFKVWYRTSDKKTELTTYYETSTRHTVTQAINNNKIEIYRTEQVAIDSLIQLSDVLESPYLYVNTVRASLYQALEIPKPTARENYGRMEVQLSLNLSLIHI